jgi:hypothetical protein
MNPPSDEPKKNTSSDPPKNAVVYLLVAALLLVLAVVGRSSYTPLILDQMFGITAHVEKTLNLKIDSGYSATFIFEPRRLPGRPNPAPQLVQKVNNTLLFSAERGQRVTLTVKYFNPYEDKDFLLVTVDQSSQKIRQQLVKLDITKKLDSQLGADLHVLRIDPIITDFTQPFSVETVILVERTE